MAAAREAVPVNLDFLMAAIRPGRRHTATAGALDWPARASLHPSGTNTVSKRRPRITNHVRYDGYARF